MVIFGRTRLDKRWHSAKPRHHHSIFEDYKEADTWHWATEQVDLLALEERKGGKWEDVRPDRTIRIIGEDEIPERPVEPVYLEDLHFKAVAFRVDLPADLPHTCAATSCRYSYFVLVRSQVGDQVSWEEKQIWIQSATTRPTTDPDGIVHLQLDHSLRVMAHSSGLPSYVSTSDLNQLRRLAVNHQFPTVGKVKTLEIRVPSGGLVCCMSTIGAIETYPGRHAYLVFDFPDEEKLVPCYQISACFQGQEIAIQSNGSRNRAKIFQLDTGHERIDPDCVERVSLDLFCPEDTPCTISTPVLEISYTIIVDVTIKEKNYQNLHLEIPCFVSNALAGFEKEEPDEMTEAAIWYQKTLHGEDPAFPTLDILDDLRTLSISMAKECGIGP